MAFYRVVPWSGNRTEIVDFQGCDVTEVKEVGSFLPFRAKMVQQSWKEGRQRYHRCHGQKRKRHQEGSSIAHWRLIRGAKDSDNSSHPNGAKREQCGILGFREFHEVHHATMVGSQGLFIAFLLIVLSHRNSYAALPVQCRQARGGSTRPLFRSTSGTNP
ncbi:hypothetical protein PU724_30380 [Mesorhizobium abyssinicae]